MPKPTAHTPRSAGPATSLATAAPGWRGALARAVDTVVAFATLRDVEDPSPRPAARFDATPLAAPERPRFGRLTAPERAGHFRVHDHPHPHRRPLAPPRRARRPGAVPAEAQACTTPLPLRRPRTRAHSADR